MINLINKSLVKYEDEDNQNIFKVILNDLNLLSAKQLGFGRCEVNGSLTQHGYEKQGTYSEAVRSRNRGNKDATEDKINRNMCMLAKLIVAQPNNGLTWANRILDSYIIYFVYKYVFKNVRKTHQINQSI